MCFLPIFLDLIYLFLVLGTLDSAVTECMEAMRKSLLLSSLVQDIPKDDIEKGLDQLKSRFVKKMEPISGKLEVANRNFQ